MANHGFTLNNLKSILMQLCGHVFSLMVVAIFFLLLLSCQDDPVPEEKNQSTDIRIRIDDKSGKPKLILGERQTDLSEFLDDVIVELQHNEIDLIQNDNYFFSVQGQKVKPEIESPGSSANPRQINIIHTHRTAPIFTFGRLTGGGSGEPDVYFYADRMLTATEVKDLPNYESFDKLSFTPSNNEYEEFKKGFTDPRTGLFPGFPDKSDFKKQFRLLAPDGKADKDVNKCGSGSNIPPYKSQSDLEWFIAHPNRLVSFKKNITTNQVRCNQATFHRSRKCVFKYQKNLVGQYSKFTCESCN